MKFRVKWFKLMDEVVEAQSVAEITAKIAPNSWENDPDVQGDFLHSIEPLGGQTGLFPTTGGTPGTPTLVKYEVLDLTRKAA